MEKPNADVRAYRITDVCETTGLGRTTIYAALRDGHLRARKFGRTTVVLADDLDAFLKALPPARSHRESSAAASSGEPT
jgi:excisionase family DNA binding protein